MADETKTTFADVEQKFHSMPLTKYEIPEALEAEWLSTAVTDFELNLGCDLGYNEETREFSGKLESIAVRTLAQMMYVSYLQRELSRVMAFERDLWEGYSADRPRCNKACDKTGA